MRRRDFITGIAGSAAAWPSAAWAQPRRMPVVGFLRSTGAAGSTYLVAAFRQGLKEAGFIEGQNVSVEYRWADDRNDRLPSLSTDLVARSVDVIVGNTPSALAAKAVTKTIPIVFVTGGDPISEGLVTSLNRPEGNVTGLVFFFGLLGSKRLELMRQLAPKATAIGMIVNPGSPNTDAERRDVQTAARAIGQELVLLDVSTGRDIETAFEKLVGYRAGALLIGAGAFLNSNRERIVALAARHQLPAMYAQREAVLAGGLMSYGPSITDAHRQAGIYAGRILKGERPADLPVMRSTRFELVLNLKTVRALGLTVPPTLLALADEVIE
jgi:putative ABC transport system substrate-binding protein